ncbi:MAG TPA: class I SAM-dependent rRNA methyltransferase [Verrucomicrobiales bacterium]|nr:class I SAM-dependent rRNA methyltransferase [Verrucomicrobiales bacterium]
MSFRPPARRPPGNKTARFQAAAAPAGSEGWTSPWIQMKYFSYHPTIYPAMIKAVSPDAGPGRWVTVYDKEGQPFGHGLYNPGARVPLRMIHHGQESVDDTLLDRLVEQAIQLRLDTLTLTACTDAFRVVHSDGDSLSGLIVDKFGDTLSIEVHSLGIYERLSRWLPVFREKLGTRRTVVEVDPHIARMEGIRIDPKLSDPVRSVRIREHGVRYEVNFAEGHKTGFFNDQRENRFRFSRLTKGLRVLDLCCYTGGFAVSAAVAGGAADVTGVDLDEKAVEQAKRNANLNQARVNWVHCDAFAYARQMQQNAQTWDAVVLDPPKFVLGREEYDDGRHKYEDLNQLAISLVKPGGLYVTCSCSGLVELPDFERMVIKGAHRQARKLQFLDVTGAGPDHPVMSNCPESRYLKVIWARVW